MVDAFCGSSVRLNSGIGTEGEVSDKQGAGEAGLTMSSSTELNNTPLRIRFRIWAISESHFLQAYLRKAAFCFIDRLYSSGDMFSHLIWNQFSQMWHSIPLCLRDTARWQHGHFELSELEDILRIGDWFR